MYKVFMPLRLQVKELTDKLNDCHRNLVYAIIISLLIGYSLGKHVV